MRWVLATAAGFLVLAATWPVICVQGEFDEGSCTSALFLPTIGTAESADSWAVVVSLPAALIAFLVVLRLTQRR